MNEAAEFDIVNTHMITEIAVVIKAILVGDIFIASKTMATILITIPYYSFDLQNQYSI